MATLYVPGSVMERERVLRCEVCGKDFPIDHKTQFIRHVKACSNRHADRMEAKVAEIESNYFASPVDKELYEHFRRGGN